jgi:NTP pyrophosphatase (non-canonical NTP hydrolase)
MIRAEMDIADFQKLVRDRYYATDSARGPAATFLWLAEEFGELAEAIAKHQRTWPGPLTPNISRTGGRKGPSELPHR